jgi:galactokinase
VGTGDSLWHEFRAKYLKQTEYSGKEMLEMLRQCAFFNSTDRLLKDAGLERDQVEVMGKVFKPKYVDYILAEISRVRDIFTFLSDRRLSLVGGILLKTHYGMSDIYEAGTPQNWKIVEILTDVEDVIGGRIVGAGFGGANMLAILGDTQAQREEVFGRAKAALAAEGFTNVHMVPPGNGSAVVEIGE